MKYINGMKGVTNSAVDPAELVDSECECRTLLHALKDPDYLIALLQKHVYDLHSYDPEDDRFANVTPETYRRIMNDMLAEVATVIVETLIATGKRLEDEFPRTKVQG